MTKYLLFAIFLCLFLAGCNPIRGGGAVVMSTMVDEAEMVICNDASVGSIRRKYGGTRAAAEKWQSFCGTVDIPIVEAE